MRKILFTLMSAVALAGNVSAQTPKPPKVSAAFALLDADHDGVISADEIAHASIALASVDRDKDGKVTEEEIRPPKPPKPGAEGSKEAMALTADELVKGLMLFDRNGNGKLEKNELPERMQGMFERGDSNKDGTLSGDEIRTLAEAQSAPAARPGGPEPGIMRTDPILSALDRDHDGVLSAAEIAGAAAALKPLDKNQDGQITLDETRPNAVPGGGR